MSFDDCSFCDKPVLYITFDNFLSKDVSDCDVDSLCKSSHFSLLNNFVFSGGMIPPKCLVKNC